MKEKFALLWAKAVENKELLIRVGAATAGVLVGATVATIIASRQAESYLLEELLMEQESEDTLTPTE